MERRPIGGGPSKPSADDRPIKGSQTGGYNLNFIDWNNEWEHILDGGNGTGEDDPNLIDGIYNCPAGMDPETFRDLIAQEFAQMEEEKTTGLSKEKIQALKKMKMGKSKQVCPICLANFEPGTFIRQLPCKHIFHEECIDKWLVRSCVCPMCKLNLDTD